MCVDRVQREQFSEVLEVAARRSVRIARNSKDDAVDLFVQIICEHPKNINTTVAGKIPFCWSVDSTKAAVSTVVYHIKQSHCVCFRRI